MSSTLYDFATWEPLLRVLRADKAKALAEPGGYVTGRVGLHGWSLPLTRRMPPPGQAAQVEDSQDEYDAVARIHGALIEAGVDDIAFTAEIAPSGRAVLRLLGPGPAVEPGVGTVHPAALILVEGAVAEPWRRQPEPAPDAVPAPTADPALLERTLRERIPDAGGATEEELAATEARLGVVLPDELKALYRVTRARWEDWGGDHAVADRVFEAVGCELLPLEGLYLAEPETRPTKWSFAAMDAVVTPSDAEVQGLVGSPGWIVFGSDNGEPIAVDLTPGPRGHLGQIIFIGYDEHTGADLIADSLTDMVLNGPDEEPRRHRRDAEPPVVAHVNHHAIVSVEAAAHPGLEVLSLGFRDGEPFGLAPVIGLPRLRTLSAYPGSLADPLEIARLTGLEFLELPPEDWRVLLDAGAVPRTLLAAAIVVLGNPHPLPIVDLANEILALWDRPPIVPTLLEGDLGPLS